MIRPIVRDIFFLSIPSKEAEESDIPVGTDMRDTLRAHREGCIGMAANMIGVSRRIIIVDTPMGDILMFNPRIVSKQGPYEAEEGCLSLDGTRKATRYSSIEVEFTDEHWRRQKMRLCALTAQAVQHEMDHLEGIII